MMFYLPINYIPQITLGEGLFFLFVFNISIAAKILYINFFFIYKIEILLYPNLSVYIYIYINFGVKFINRF